VERYKALLLGVVAVIALACALTLPLLQRPLPYAFMDGAVLEEDYIARYSGSGSGPSKSTHISSYRIGRSFEEVSSTANRELRAEGWRGLEGVYHERGEESLQVMAILSTNGSNASATHVYYYRPLSWISSVWLTLRGTRIRTRHSGGP
jgi:hypothetical protein